MLPSKIFSERSSEWSSHFRENCKYAVDLSREMCKDATSMSLGLKFDTGRDFVVVIHFDSLSIHRAW